MPEKDEPIYATRARYGIVAHNSLATRRFDWTLAPAPTQLEYGRLPRSRPASSAPCPHPQLTGKSLWLYVVSFDWGGRRERMSF
ncbi:MAG: hypothetical protein ACE5FB_07595 [Candidatus Binatia bacterium]